MRIGAVVLTYEPGSVTDRTMQAVAESSHPVSQLVVVDNSPAATPALRVLGGPARLIRRADNPGYGTGMNQGAQEISKLGCDAVLFLTQETVIARQTIGELAAALESDPRCGVTGPLLCRRSEPHTVWSAGGSLRGVWRGTPRHIGRGASADTIPATTADVDWLDGACLLVSREAFGAVGGFRDDLFLYWEDVDLCRRLAASGYHVRCVRSARAYQEPSMTPPYLAARNRALVLGTRGAISAAITLFKHAAADAGRGDGLRRAELELRGLLDARSGRLDRSIALERPRGCAR